MAAGNLLLQLGGPAQGYLRPAEDEGAAVVLSQQGHDLHDLLHVPDVAAEAQGPRLPDGDFLGRLRRRKGSRQVQHFHRQLSQGRLLGQEALEHVAGQ